MAAVLYLTVSNLNLIWVLTWFFEKSVDFGGFRSGFNSQCIPQVWNLLDRFVNQSKNSYKKKKK